MSRLFASPLPSEERFRNGAWRMHATEAPALDGAQANIFCLKEKSVDYGSHTIFIGRVTRVLVRPDISPLLYQDGNYAAASALPAKLK